MRADGEQARDGVCNLWEAILSFAALKTVS